MKVLHYAVFKDPRFDSRGGVDRMSYERESSLEDVPSKLSSTAGSDPKLNSGSLPERRLVRGGVRRRLLKQSRYDPQLDLSHNWPANPWMYSFVCGRRKYVRHSVSGDR